MTTKSVLSQATELTDWSAAFSQLAYASEPPQAVGVIKSCPTDFQVDEQMAHTPTGEGEHIWLKVRKERQNTEQVAKGLARFASVALRDVGYSGLKDFQAVTTQWFSVWLPKSAGPDWSGFDMFGVELLEVSRHSRKLKRGTHQANRFIITVRDLVADREQLISTLSNIKETGVPNYFGVQRFGRDFNNLRLANSLLVERRPIKNRNLKSIVLSSARSWLFNQVVSQRIRLGTWNELYLGEPANLDGTNSTFLASGEPDELGRLTQLDIHPTAPLVGRDADKAMAECPSLQAMEAEWLAPYNAYIDGLCRLGLDYQRRALRSRVHDLTWSFDDDCLRLEFVLQRGQFATSVLRELLLEST
ncbi:tRNA pseudouridine(13) synthase TruD [Arenicella xantha]|uniref:tRNA pseudouridine synthase D n=1 Tax=Arenicella xantha TaxID=644221 RepID=A0A395JJZ8_9GAMM|nr:tRNA pseudouridine(13) synthase TruD [Arenicella xantha]RBP49222.1 tRNA pseudouridine13 synthase [Arenicella xantha]